ncbi:MotE family protein [Neobacillus drentensis]|uniref:MotE family protein n=1 Tax=Neobacillus drentensis TaxID=220684 RepID=UPI002FFE89B5
MEEKHRSKLANITYIVIIPLIATVILVAFLLKFMGFSVGKTFQEWGNQIPLINQLVPEPATVQAEGQDDTDYWKNKYVASNSAVKELNQKMSNLKKDLSTNQNSLEVLKQKNTDLETQLKEKETQKSQEDLKQVAAIYENMSPSKAAKIFEAMSLEDASVTLMMLGQEQQSNILGGMKDPKKAAQITMMLKEIPSLYETEQQTIEEQVQELALKQENPADTLSETIAGMPAAQSAIIIQSMMKSNSIVAMELMKNISTTTRSQILTEITKVDAKLAALITADLNN